MPAWDSVLSFALGFMAATLLLHGAGIVTVRLAVSSGPRDTTVGSSKPQRTRRAQAVRGLELNVTVAPTTVAGHVLQTATYNASLPGPTLRVKPGDRMEIKLINNLTQPGSPPPPPQKVVDSRSRPAPPDMATHSSGHMDPRRRTGADVPVAVDVPRSIDAIAAGITDMLSRPRTDADRSDLASHLVTHSWSAVFARYGSIYRELIGKKRAKAEARATDGAHGEVVGQVVGADLHRSTAPAGSRSRPLRASSTLCSIPSIPM